MAPGGRIGGKHCATDSITDSARAAAPTWILDPSLVNKRQQQLVELAAMDCYGGLGHVTSAVSGQSPYPAICGSGDAS